MWENAIADARRMEQGASSEASSELHRGFDSENPETWSDPIDDSSDDSSDLGKPSRADRKEANVIDDSDTVSSKKGQERPVKRTMSSMMEESIFEEEDRPRKRAKLTKAVIQQRVDERMRYLRGRRYQTRETQHEIQSQMECDRENARSTHERLTRLDAERRARARENSERRQQALQQRRDGAARNVAEPSQSPLFLNRTATNPREQDPSGTESPPNDLFDFGPDERLADHALNLRNAQDRSVQARINYATLMRATYWDLMQRIQEVQQDTRTEVMDYVTASFLFFDRYSIGRPRSQGDLEEEQQTDQPQQSPQDENQSDGDEGDKKPSPEEKDAQNKEEHKD
jgi:hypothetical protein